MTAPCPECGASVAMGATCQDYFHELLALESHVPDAQGALPHFFAVASYNLQHPSGFMPAALTGLRITLADVLAGRATVEEARRRARLGAAGAARVRRRAQEILSQEEPALLIAWPRRWPMTVLDVCRVRPEEYVERVRHWAAAVSATLEQYPPEFTR